MSTRAYTQEDEEELEEPIIRLSRDLRDAAALMSPDEVRYFVDSFYTMQNSRKANGARLRQLRLRGKPSRVIDWWNQNAIRLEGQVHAALDRWTDAQPVGRWAKSLYGVGPVLTAGFLAHLDITKAPTVSNFWRFAGQDPTLEWQGRNGAKEIVEAALEVEKAPLAAIVWLSQALHQDVPKLILHAGGPSISRTQAQDALEHHYGADPDVVRLIRQSFAQFPYKLGVAVRNFCVTYGVEESLAWQLILGAETYQLDMDKLQAWIARRPWNARLKSLCWSWSDVQVKFSNDPQSFYGPLYRERKELEVRANDSGEYQEVAAAFRQERRWKGKAREAYEAGRLPDSQIDGRARRWIVKLFLQHLHYVMHQEHYGEPPPPVYAIKFLGHTGELPPPNWPME